MWKKRNKNKARESKPVASAWRNPVEDSLRWEQSIRREYWDVAIYLCKIISITVSSKVWIILKFQSLIVS
jgi:hypothetical protein